LVFNQRSIYFIDVNRNSPTHHQHQQQETPQTPCVANDNDPRPTPAAAPSADQVSDESATTTCLGHVTSSVVLIDQNLNVNLLENATSRHAQGL